MNYLFLYLLICLIVIFYYFFLFRNLNEKYTNQCSVTKKYNKFCTWNHNSDICTCAFQQGDTNVSFPISNDCCSKKCNMLPKELCQYTGKKSTRFYWCPVANKCEKFPAYINESMISANNCGYDKLTNQKIYPYLSEEDCKKAIEPCDIYNNKNSSDNKNRDDCLNNTYCGWCTNNNGIGKCVSGTASGPINIYKYNFCKIDNKGNTNSYSYRKKIIL